MSIKVIPNVYDRSFGLLAAQFRDSLANGSMTNFQKFIYAMATEAQTIQSQLQIMNTQRWLGTNENPSGVGEQLDGIGQIVGLARIPGQSDEDYREDLQFQIFINVSQATPEEIIFYTQYLTTAEKVIYIEYYPAAYEVIVDSNFIDSNNLPLWPVPANLAVTALKNVSPAGVAYPVIITTMSVPRPFSFSSDVILEPLYVTKDEFLPPNLVPLDVDGGSGAEGFFIQEGETVNPLTGGGFSEYGTPIDTTGAGQLAEVVQLNGNLPP